MIKVDAKKGTIEISGVTESVMYGEAGIVLKRVYEELKESHGEKRAKKLIMDLTESALLSEEETKQQHEKLKKEDPVGYKFAEMQAELEIERLRRCNDERD